jgi:hypothetical protein
MPNSEDYELCELENTNLRNALAWTAEHLATSERAVLAERLDAPIERGGVTGTDALEEREDVVSLLLKLVQHLEPLLLDPPPSRVRQSIWIARLDALLTQARTYEPKHPLMRRIGGHPNVFAPVRGPV